MKTLEDGGLIDDSQQLSGAASGGVILGLLSDVATAGRIAKIGRRCHLEVRNADKADNLLEWFSRKKIALVILDWDHCEAQAYSLLERVPRDDGRCKTNIVGFLSRSDKDLKRAALNAGCDRVYSRTEFMKELEDIIARCAL